MKRRLFCLILSAIFILSGISVMAKTKSTQEQFKILSGLDIVCAGEFDEDKADTVINKSTFLNYALNLMLDKKYTEYYDSEALALAEQMRLIVSAKDVGENDKLSKNEALTIAVRLLGYEGVAKELGGYPTGYSAAAAQCGIITTLSEQVTYAESYDLLYNVLEADRSDFVINSNGDYVSYENKVNALEHFRKIYKVEGIITENGESGLYGDSTVGEGFIMVGNEVYDVGDSTASKLLGHEVELYIKDTTDQVHKVICVIDKSEEDTVTIDADNVASVNSTLTKIDYYRDKNSSKVLSEDIASDAAFLFNGVAYSDCKKEDFIKEGTKIVLTDNDGDKDFDVVNFVSYETMIVSSVSQSSEKIYNYYTYDIKLAELDLSEYDDENISIYKNGEKATLSDLSTGDVLAIYKTPKGKDGRIEINVESNAFSGVVESFSDSENIAVVDGKEIEVSDLYIEALKNGEKYARAIMPGTKYMLRCNADGKIIAAEIISGDDLAFGYVTKYFYNEDNGTEIRFRMFMEDGSWENVKLAKKVKHNGTRTVAVEDVLTDAEILGCIPSLIGVKLNSDGEVCAIETPVEYEETISQERLNTTGEQSVTYRYNGTTFANKFYMTGSTKVFIVPKDETADESNYRIGNNYSFIADSSYNITGYNRDKFYTLDMVVNKRDTDSIKTVSNTVYMVKNIGIKASEDGDVLPFVNVASDTYAGVTLEGVEGIFEGVKKGDLIKIHINNEGLIDNCSVIYSETDGTEKVLPDSNGRNGNAAIVKGFAMDKDVAEGKLLVDTVEEMAFMVSSSKAVLIYDAENKEVSVGSLNDIERGDFVIVNLSKSAVSMVAVYKGL